MDEINKLFLTRMYPRKCVALKSLSDTIRKNSDKKSQQLGVWMHNNRNKVNKPLVAKESQTLHYIRVATNNMGEQPFLHML